MNKQKRIILISGMVVVTCAVVFVSRMAFHRDEPNLVASHGASVPVGQKPQRSGDADSVLDSNAQTTRAEVPGPDTKSSAAGGSQIDPIGPHVQASRGLFAEVFDSSLSFQLRNKALKRLASDSLTAQNISEIEQFLRSFMPDSFTTDYEVLSDAGIRNNLMILLRQQKVDAGEILSVYENVATNALQHLTLRDYSLQHLGSLHGEVDGVNPSGVRIEGDEQVLQKIEKILWAATDVHDGTLSGTALLNLYWIHESGHLLMQESDIMEKATKVARDSSASEATQISALQISSLLEPDKALPLLRDLAATSELQMLRMAAISHIGQHGNVSDSKLLKRIALENIASLSVAINKSLEQLH